MKIPLIPSHRARPSDDAIFALNSEANARKKRGESIVNATVGALLEDDGRLSILPSAARAVREVAPEEWAAYAPIAGTPDFLRAVMDDLLGLTPALRACAVAAATPGGTGALRHAISAYLEPGQALLTSSYYWGPYHTIADASDRKVAVFPMFASVSAASGNSSGTSSGNSSGNSGRLDLDGFDRALGKVIADQGRALIFMNDPCHNPTGYSMTAEEWQGMVDIVARHGERAPVTLLLDLAYADYASFNPRERLAMLVPLLGKVGLVFAWSASKSFTHYGLRVGAIIACVADETERAMTEAAFSYLCRGTWSNCVRGGLSAITRLLVDPALSRACTDERAVLKARLEARVATWNRHAMAAGLPYPRYEGGFFVTVFRPDAREHALRMKEQGVFVVPQQGALRVALCSVAEQDIERLVAALAAKPG